MTIVDQSTAVTANSTGVIVSTTTTANEKGGWTEMIASTSEETYWITMTLNGETGSDKQGFLLDIGVGAASSEVVKIPNISGYMAANYLVKYMFPLTIASGSRVSVRASNSQTTVESIQVMLYLSNDDSQGTSTVNANYGAVTTSSKGTVIEADGTTDDTKGGYSELVLSTSIDIDYFVFMIGSNNNGTITPSQKALVDLATGDPETDIIANIPYGMSSIETAGSSVAAFHSIPSGTRLASRMQTNDSVAAGSNDRRLDVLVLGFTMTAPAGGSSGVLGQIGLNGGLQ